MGYLIASYPITLFLLITAYMFATDEVPLIRFLFYGTIALLLAPLFLPYLLYRTLT